MVQGSNRERLVIVLSVASLVAYLVICDYARQRDRAREARSES